ncbi:MAG: glycosyltransferase, partial [Gemmataceae bacterium]
GADVLPALYTFDILRQALPALKLEVLAPEPVRAILLRGMMQSQIPADAVRWIDIESLPAGARSGLVWAMAPETCGPQIVDALAAGSVVLATDSRQTRLRFVDSPVERLPPNDRPQWAYRTMKLLEDTSCREALAERGPAWVADNCTLKDAVRHLQHLYDGAILSDPVSPGWQLCSAMFSR